MAVLVIDLLDPGVDLAADLGRCPLVRVVKLLRLRDLDVELGLDPGPSSKLSAT
jgi:hypothetical protein